MSEVREKAIPAAETTVSASPTTPSRKAEKPAGQQHCRGAQTAQIIRERMARRGAQFTGDNGEEGH